MYSMDLRQEKCFDRFEKLIKRQVYLEHASEWERWRAEQFYCLYLPSISVSDRNDLMETLTLEKQFEFLLCHFLLPMWSLSWAYDTWAYVSDISFIICEVRILIPITDMCSVKVCSFM